MIKKKFWIIIKAHYVDGETLQELVDLFPDEKFEESWYRYYPESLLIEVINHYDHEMERAKALAFDLGWCEEGSYNGFVSKNINQEIVLDPL